MQAAVHIRDARLHARDEHVPDRQRRQPRRRVARRGLPDRSSTSPTTRPSSRPSTPRTCRSRSPSRGPPPTRTTPSRWSAGRCPTSCRTRSATPTAPPSRSPSWPSEPWATSGCATPSTGDHTRTAGVSEWNGGERYGDGFDRYIAEYRGTVTGTSAGTSAGVVHRRSAARLTVTSPDFTYQVADGHRWRRPGPGRGGRHRRQPACKPPRARSTPRRTPPTSRPPATPRTSTTSTPMVVGLRTTSGCCRTTTRSSGRPATTSFRESIGQPGGTAAPLALDLELTVRDYLNEGGKALVTRQVQPVRPGGGRRLLVQPVRASAVHDAERVPVPAAAQRLPAVLAGGLRLPRRHGRGRERRARARCWVTKVRSPASRRPSTAPGRRTTRTTRPRS